MTSKMNSDLFKTSTSNNVTGEAISRPLLTYWQDAFMRLRKNKIALGSFLTILFMGLVGIIGPFFFPASVSGISYENQQNPDFKAQDPTLGEKLLVQEAVTLPEDMIAPNFVAKVASPLPEKLEAPAEFEVVGQSTVNGVVLKWKPMDNVTGYRVFRVTAAASEVDAIKDDVGSRGVTLGEVSRADQYSYTDSAGLDPSEDYVYSIVSYAIDPVSGAEIQSEKAQAVAVKVTKVISLEDALKINPNAKIGEEIRGRAYFFGTDGLGRDVFARTVQGARIDFFLALVIPTISLLVGLIYGSISALSGGAVDNFMMRIVEVVLSIPELLFLILLQVVLGKGVGSLVVALSVIGWETYARVIRGEVLRLREIEFVHASKLLGASSKRVIFKHIAPNLAGLMIVMWSARIPGVIAAEAFLSFLGLGLEAPAASWGTVLYESAGRIQSNPLQFFLPASVLGVTLLAFFLLGDALRDAFDPKLKGRD